MNKTVSTVNREDEEKLEQAEIAFA